MNQTMGGVGCSPHVGVVNIITQLRTKGGVRRAYPLSSFHVVGSGYITCCCRA